MMVRVPVRVAVGLIVAAAAAGYATGRAVVGAGIRAYSKIVGPVLPSEAFGDPPYASEVTPVPRTGPLPQREEPR